MGRVLVTGASGFLGGALVAHLRALGHDVIGTGRQADRLSGDSVAVDLNDANAQMFAGVDRIIHCAALSSPWGPRAAFEVANVTATKQLLQIGQALGVRQFIHISTPTIYFRFADQIDVREDADLPAPVNAYAATKAHAETLVQSSPLQTTILRPRGIYGAGDTALVPRLLRAAQSGPLPLFRKGRVATDITHVDDVIGAICAVLDQPDNAAGQTFNVSGGTPLKIKDVVTDVCARHGITPRWRALPVRPALAAVRAGEWIARRRKGQPEPRVTAYGLGIFAYTQTLDLGAIRAQLGWSPQISFADGLARTFPE